MKTERLGPYQIVRELGRGGMGTVYEGINLETGEPAAVKLLSAPLAREEGFRERFAAEIETLRKLNHPNIVRLFGFGDQDEQLYYAMELVDGSSLEQELQCGRQFNWREVTRIGIETCRALRHAHDRGVIHRDIKPGNLLVTRDGQVKLSDFGIARLFGNARLTNAGSVLGTAEYMAPEQAAGKPVGPRADLYSLGVVFYVLLTRRPLFRTKSLPEVLHKQQVERPDPVGRYASDVPEMLEAIIAQLLEKDPDRRIPNPALLGRQLQAMERALSLKPDLTDTDTVEDEFAAQPLPNNSVESDSPMPAVDDLPDTKASGAFKKSISQSDETDRQEPKPTGSFIAVAEEELDRVESSEAGAPWISLQTWALAIGLIAVGLTVWYFLQPPSRDALYEKITAQTGDGTITSLLEAEDDIEKFLALFSDDPRCSKLREYKKEIELHGLEQTFRLRAKGLAGTESLVPIGRDYLEAINYVRLDPELGMAKLQALVDLYDHRRDTTGPAGNCLELARRRLERLQEQLAQQMAQRRALVQRRLKLADDLSRTDPRRARAMYRAVIELYQDKPWADEAVRRAREALQTDSTQGPADTEKPNGAAHKE